MLVHLKICYKASYWYLINTIITMYMEESREKQELLHSYTLKWYLLFNRYKNLNLHHDYTHTKNSKYKYYTYINTHTEIFTDFNLQ